MKGFHLVVLGLTISSSWGNGHATTYRALLRALAGRGARITFLERDVSWYRDNRDLPAPNFVDLQLYEDIADLRGRFAPAVRDADAVMVGSYVPDGIEVIDWVTDVARGPVAFYDIDTPVTLARLERGDCRYLAPRQVPHFDVYLSFTGGPTLDRLVARHGAQSARALFCTVDTERYQPTTAGRATWRLGYLGTYSDDRQKTLDRLLLGAARRLPQDSFVVAGPQYPDDIRWPGNVARIDHLPPAGHPAFYNSQAFTLNVTRADMIAAGWSPSVRLFEAAACGTPIISDGWDGLGELFPIGEAICVAETTDDVLACLELSERERTALGAAAREIVLSHHGAAARAAELESFLQRTRPMEGTAA